MGLLLAFLSDFGIFPGEVSSQPPFSAKLTTVVQASFSTGCTLSRPRLMSAIPVKIYKVRISRIGTSTCLICQVFYKRQNQNLTESTAKNLYQDWSNDFPTLQSAKSIHTNIRHIRWQLSWGWSSDLLNKRERNKIFCSWLEWNVYHEPLGIIFIGFLVRKSE